ncbi:hypothetical protein S7711_02323 [Stachybotrys chartarum IBT 7711]|uniref:Actin-like ATPase domain-containing protein n=1 Tax=Stachybotrys chartarum (strain CBS 109288 / IBT 7711) TaxID=1280523 RepID=A0A084B0Y4_STACB|nr:hypothetical protein S7711_02323 [Stachybotrys chartarum IBT 7711]KFA56389.1 hypothetical protein S40293_05021 [Stachybotrys chartarum IBT 40293]KFA71146.1 hypothetical protein S40288_04702 [Stachybotrys chartarum IBT 40288]
MPTDKELARLMERLRASEPSTWQSDEKLIISLDFGTTYSGIGFCFANQRNSQVAAVMNWPGASGESVPKIPTLINYHSDSPRGTSFSWGASVDRKLDNIVGVKLLLDPKQELPLYLPTGNIKQDLKKLPKPPVDVAADFIGAIYKHALTEISKEVLDGYMDICQKDFVISVPAVWSDAAKDATLQASAAKKAGLYPVTLIKEPEAAALYTLHALDFVLAPDDAFIICDAGGGTVDLISYEVEQVIPQLKLKELVPGNGGRAGSLGLNQRFAEAVANLVGDDQWYILKKSKGFALAEKQFDREVKKSFRGSPSEEYFVNFPMADLEDDPENRLESNTWLTCLLRKDVEDIFKPLISDILRLIDDQVKSVQIKRPRSGITGIFLVGGFGSSQYLKTCVEHANPGVNVLQPSDAWGAIVKGAALSKLPQQAKVVSTSATKHYGVEALSHYDDSEDQGMPKHADAHDGSIKVQKMTWYINIGDDLQRDQTVKFPFYRTLDHDFSPSDLVFKDTLFECGDPIAPRHRSKGRNISPNCTLTANLQDVPRTKFEQKTDKYGGPYYRVSYNLVISIDSALMSFSLELDGKKYGSVEAKFA